MGGSLPSWEDAIDRFLAQIHASASASPVES
jgi:hypothetical protein